MILLSKEQPLSIIGIFLEDHDRIESMLSDFKKHKHEGSKKTYELFKDLSGALVRHFHQEEILYSTYKHKTGQIIAVLQTVREEHEIILKKLSKINDSLMKQNSDIDVSELFTLLQRHKNVEDRLLYPELDRVLTDKEREEVYWKIKVS